MRKINFKCPACGGKQVLQVETGAVLKSPIKELEVAGGIVELEYENEGTLIVTDESEVPMQIVCYECADCGSFLVRGDGEPCITPEDLFRWLRGEGMLGGEEDRNEKDIVSSVAWNKP
jgi:hypothetical protein